MPTTTVSVDSRIELIQADARAHHLALSGGAADWSAILDLRGVTIVVAARDEQRALIPLLRTSPDWRLAIEEGDGEVFVKQ